MRESSTHYVWNRSEASQPLAHYFMTHEFVCSCGRCEMQMMSVELLSRLTKARQTLGQPIIIHSGYRCEEKQALLKAEGYETAAGVSQHTLGNAVDVAIAPELMAQLLTALKELFTSIGVANSFIHIDTRVGPHAWSYKTL